MAKAPMTRHRFVVEITSTSNIVNKAEYLKRALDDEFTDARIVAVEELAPLYFPLGEVDDSTPPRTILDDVLTEANIEKFIDIARRIKA